MIDNEILLIPAKTALHSPIEEKRLSSYLLLEVESWAEF